jgi:hypothetical protein
MLQHRGGDHAQSDARVRHHRRSSGLVRCRLQPMVQLSMRAGMPARVLRQGVCHAKPRISLVRG